MYLFIPFQIRLACPSLGWGLARQICADSGACKDGWFNVGVHVDRFGPFRMIVGACCALEVF